MKSTGRKKSGHAQAAKNPQSVQRLIEASNENGLAELDQQEPSQGKA